MNDTFGRVFALLLGLAVGALIGWIAGRLIGFAGLGVALGAASGVAVTASIDALRVSSPKASAKVIREIMEGKEGPARDIVLLNTAAALVVAGAADDVASALETAAHGVDTGRAAEALENLAKSARRE
mgnify:CR=1 FL=1